MEKGSVDCPSPAARGGETNDVPAWAPISQLFPLWSSETLKWSVDSTFCSSHRPSLSDRLDGSTGVDRGSPPRLLVCGWQSYWIGTSLSCGKLRFASPRVALQLWPQKRCQLVKGNQGAFFVLFTPGICWPISIESKGHVLEQTQDFIFMYFYPYADSLQCVVKQIFHVCYLYVLV